MRAGNTLTLYINGTKTDSMTVNGAAIQSSEPLTFGRYGDMYAYYFTGVIARVDITKGLARWTSNFIVSAL